MPPIATRCLINLFAGLVLTACDRSPIAVDLPPPSHTAPTASNPVASVTPPQVAPAERVDEGALSLFQAADVKGAFVLRNTRQGTTTIVNPTMAQQGFLPASTFKIPNTLIGLATGVIPDEHFALKWDGIHRNGLPEWNADHDLTSAMRNSVVWFYQEIARRIGAERMQKHLSLFQYGNAEMGAPIDQFWLSGTLRISPRQQVDFLQRLQANQLPISVDHAAIVKRVLAFEEHDGVTMRWKTGLTEQAQETVGWMIGFVEQRDETFVFATVMTAPLNAKDAQGKVIQARITVPRQLLGRMGVIPAAMAASTRWK